MSSSLLRFLKLCVNLILASDVVTLSARTGLLRLSPARSSPATIFICCCLHLVILRIITEYFTNLWKNWDIVKYWLYHTFPGAPWRLRRMLQSPSSWRELTCCYQAPHLNNSQYHITSRVSPHLHLQTWHRALTAKMQMCKQSVQSWAAWQWHPSCQVHTTQNTMFPQIFSFDTNHTFVMNTLSAKLCKRKHQRQLVDSRNIQTMILIT